MRVRKAGRLWVAAAVVAAGAIPFRLANADDAGTLLAVDIDPLPLDAALVELSKQGHLQLVISTGTLPARTSLPLHGTMSLGVALDSLLRGTGLTYKFVGEHTIAIVAPGLRGTQLNEPSGAPGISGASGPAAAAPDPTDGQAGSGRAPSTGERSVKHSKLYLRIAAFMGICVSVTGPGTACAEGAADGSSQALEEIVVTAQKRAEPLQKVPISVSVIDSASIEKRNVGDFSQFADSVAGVTFATTGVGNSQYFIRGIGTVSQDQGPTTGVYLDEIPLQSRSMRGISQPDPQLFDVARMEVLRGPQGVLYGSSAMGGLVRIITNKPDPDRFSAKVEGSGATITDGAQSWDAKGMVNIPLASHVLGLRLVGVLGRQGGWIDDLRPTTSNLLENVGNPSAIQRDANWTDYGTMRASLQWAPSDSLTVTPSLMYQDTHSNTDRVDSDVDYGLKGRTKARFIDTFLKDKFTIGSVLVEKKSDVLGGVSLLSSSSYLDRSTEMMFDATPYWSPLVQDALGGIAPPGTKLYPVGLYDRSGTKQFTEEVRLSSTSDNPLKYTVGAFYKHLSQRWNRTGPVFDLFGAVPTGAFAATTPANLSDTLNRFTEDEYSLFGELTYAFSDRWQLAAGGRTVKYEQEDARRRYELGGAAGGQLTYDYSEHNSENAFSPRVTLSYRPGEGVNLYASYSEGLRAGGSNAPIPDAECSAADRAAAGLPDTPPPFKSDKTKNYELGAKTQWLDRRVRVNGAIYSIDWSNYQQNVQTTCGPNSIFYIANAGKVRSNGGELEIEAALTSHLSISLAASSTDATYRNAVPDLGLPAGSRLLDVPKTTWSGRIDYNVPVSAKWEGNFSLSARHVGDSVSAFGEGTPLDRPAYSLVDVNLALKKGDLAFSLYVNNLTDEVPVYGQEWTNDVTTTSAHSYFSYLVGPPRTIGLRVSKGFR